jgi:hypothetical protein
MCMCQRVASAARARPVVPVGPTAGSAASYSAVQLLRGQRTARGPGWARCRRRLMEHAARCWSCGVADGIVNQVGPSCTAHGSSELVKAHTPSRGRPSCRNTDGLCGISFSPPPSLSFLPPSLPPYLYVVLSVCTQVHGRPEPTSSSVRASESVTLPANQVSRNSEAEVSHGSDICS